MADTQTKDEDQQQEKQVPVEKAEAIAQAKASVEKVNEKRAKGEVDRNDFSQPRTKRGSRDRSLTVSQIALPEGFSIDGIGPTGFAAVFTDPDGNHLAITGDVDTQEFYVDPEKAQFLTFSPPGQNLPKKRLYTVKGLHRDGRLVQLPVELQIQNNAGGDPEDLIGLRRYQRKGILILIDWETRVPVYCAAWGCYAQGHGLDTEFPGFCSMRHAQHTLPNRYKGAGQIVKGLMESGVTTSRTWEV